MSDTLRQRVSRVIASGAHALLDAVEDAAPVALMEQSVREVQGIADEVRTELGKTVANHHLAQQQSLGLQQAHGQLSVSIEQALDSGREDLAQAAVARQIDIEAQLSVLASSLAELAAQEKEISGFADALMGKQREMRRAIAAFEQSRQAAQHAALRGSGAATPVGAKLQAAQSAFDRAYRSQTGLEAASSGPPLEQAVQLKELGDLVRENKIKERLAALKAEQGRP